MNLIPNNYEQMETALEDIFKRVIRTFCRFREGSNLEPRDTPIRISHGMASVHILTYARPYSKPSRWVVLEAQSHALVQRL